jgi:PAS domain S-box-containing protein
MKKQISILLLEDSPLDAELTIAQIERGGIRAKVQRVETQPEFEEALAKGHYDLILADFSLPEFDGLSAFEIARREVPLLPFIFVSGTLGEDVAVDALQRGATDYVLKQRLDRLLPAIRRALREREERDLRLSSELALRTSEKKFRELADALPQLVWMIDNDGKVTYANRQAREYSGGIERLGLPELPLGHVEDSAKVRDRWMEAARSRSNFDVELRLLRAGAAYRWHQLRFLAVTDDAEHLTGWLVTAVDLEEHMQREEALRASRRELQMVNETLERQVAERTEAYRQLSGTLLHVQDRERRRLSRELHDGLGQYLAGIKINVELLRSQNALSPEAKERLLDQAIEMLDTCIRDVRTTSYLLHPPMLDEVGFALAASWYCEGFADRSRIKIDLSIPPDLPRESYDMEVAMFRVLQEGLLNAHRHSGCTEVNVNVKWDDEHISLTIHDNGCGISREFVKQFGEGKTQGGIGLAGMRERAKEFGGSFCVHSNGTGTELNFVVPRTSLAQMQA